MTHKEDLISRKAAVESLESQIITDDESFMAHLISEICDYAVRNKMEPNDTMRTICNNLLTILDISAFNGWKEMDE